MLCVFFVNWKEENKNVLRISFEVCELLYHLKCLQCPFNTNVVKLMFMLIDGSFFILKIINSRKLVLVLFCKCENLIRVQTCPILCFLTNGNKRCLSCSHMRQLHNFVGWNKVFLDSFYLRCVLSHNKRTKYKKLKIYFYK